MNNKYLAIKMKIPYSRQTIVGIEWWWRKKGEGKIERIHWLQQSKINVTSYV